MPSAVEAPVLLLERVLRQSGLPTRANVIDAGCGTGSHARELATRGHRVFAIDRSRELVEQARAKCSGLDVELREGELARLEKQGWADAVLCRGVLNDVLEDSARDAIIGRLFMALRPGGFILLDVRDWE